VKLAIKTILLSLFGGLIVLGLVMVAKAEPHWNYQTTMSAQDDGDSMRMFTASVGTTTPVLVYYSTQTAAPQRSAYASPDRILTIENIQLYNLFCSTTNTVSATSGNRFEIFGTTYPCSLPFQTYAAPANVWCIFETAAGSGTKEVLGWVGYDSQD
jgi:hypothetical protein